MKKFFVNFFKVLLFFLLWSTSLNFLDVESSNPVWWRFWAEMTPFFSVVFFTVIFTFFDKNRLFIPLKENFLKTSLYGMIIGFVWIIVPLAILILSNSIKIIRENPVANLEIWILSAFINVLMQEILVRGYIYQLLKKQYSRFVSIIISTLIFTLFHAGAFIEGIVPVLNVITMSVFMSFLYEYKNSLLAPVMAHSIWNIIGGIILGTVSLASDYPNLFSVIYNNFFSPINYYKLEYSILTFMVNIIMCFYFYIRMKDSKKNNIS